MIEARNPVQQQAFDERTLVLRDEVLLAAPDELPATVVAVMILLPVVSVPIFPHSIGLSGGCDTRSQG